MAIAFTHKSTLHYGYSQKNAQMLIIMMITFAMTT